MGPLFESGIGSHLEVFMPVTLREETPARKTVVGHGNFHYPGEEEVLLGKGTVIDSLPWIGGKKLHAFLSPLGVVWVDPEKLSDKG